MSTTEQLAKFEHSVARHAVLFHQYMGKAMPEAVYKAFTKLRDETIPELRAALAQHDARATDWRKLALQFAGQRMAAMMHLRTLLQFPDTHADAAREFLAASPSQQAQAAEPVTDKDWRYSIADLERIAADKGPFFADNARQALSWVRNVLIAADAAVNAAPPVREPLTDSQIDAAFAAHDDRFALVSSRWSFDAGVRFAESAHGIGGKA